MSQFFLFCKLFLFLLMDPVPYVINIYTITAYYILKPINVTEVFVHCFLRPLSSFSFCLSY